MVLGYGGDCDRAPSPKQEPATSLPRLSRKYQGTSWS